MRTAVVVTGLPASGKTSVARATAARAGLPLFDKDDFLEALFDAEGVRDWADRDRLSRRSDALFEAAARRAGSAVLVSHWRLPGGEGGTPTDWLGDAYERVIELCCLCSAETAAARFRARRRHTGHQDAARDQVDLANRFAEWAGRYPLGLGESLQVSTDGGFDVEAIGAQALIRLRSR